MTIYSRTNPFQSIDVSPMRPVIDAIIICVCVLATPTLLQLDATVQSKLGVYMVRSPESTIAPLRDEVLFECELNLEPDRLDWRFLPQTASRHDKNEYVYLNNDIYNITTEGSSSKLHVFVSREWIGEYQCVAWFGASAIASIPAKLTLAEISLSSDRSDRRGSSTAPKSVTWSVPDGNTILIKCGTVYSNPPPVWSFYKNNKPITVPTLTVPQQPIDALILANLQPSDSGTYWCSALNAITGSEFKLPQQITLSVIDADKQAPTFLTEPPAQATVRPGATALLECPGIGNPVPKAVWSRPDSTISTNRSTILNYGLKINNIQSDDRGTYVCRLDNGIAPALVHTIHLNVQEPPVIISGPQVTLTNESDPLELECLADGSPDPDIYWMINGADVRWDSAITMNGSRMIVQSVEKRHAGIVQCFARNEVGEVNFGNLLQVNPKQIPGGIGGQPLGSVPQSTRSNLDHTGKPPKGRKKHKHAVMIPPSRPSVTRLADDKVMVRWSVPNKEGLPIQFFKVQFRMLGDPSRKVVRSQWMTLNEDIPPLVRMWVVENLKPDHYYRFRIAAVYSNNDNQLSNVSMKYLLLRGSQLGPMRAHLPAPNLTRVEPISETTVVLHWTYTPNSRSPIDGFYAYYRPASTAGEYSKATVDGQHTRHFKINHLEPGTAYEFKLQSFTSSAASDFLAIITGKTLKPSTPPPPPTVIQSKSSTSSNGKSNSTIIAVAAAVGGVLLVCLILCCAIIKRKRNCDRDEDTDDNKSHPDHIQTDANGFPANGRVLHKNRLNGVSRMNITPNPLAQEGDKNRNVMELRFLPNSLAQPQQQNNNFGGTGGTVIVSAPAAHVTSSQQEQMRTIGLPIPDNDQSRRTADELGRIPSLRKGTSRRTSQPTVPGSPRVVRGGVSSELLHNRSPMPQRALVAGKRNRLGSRTENISSGSLNSIEV